MSSNACEKYVMVFIPEFENETLEINPSIINSPLSLFITVDHPRTAGQLRNYFSASGRKSGERRTNAVRRKD